MMSISRIDPDESHRPRAWLAADVALALLPSEQRAKRPSFVQAPYGTVRLDGPAGPMRLAAFRRARQPALPALAVPAHVAPFSLFDDGTEEWLGAMVDASHELPLAQDPVALAEQLDLPSRRRLLDFMLGFCRTAFRLGADRDFAVICRQVAALSCPSTATATPVASVPPGHILVRGVPSARGVSLYLIGPRGTRLIRPYNESALGEADQFLVIPTPDAADCLLACGPEARLWQISQTSPLPHVMSLTGEALTAAREACLRAFTPAKPGSIEAALLRELHLLAPAAPRRHDDPALAFGGALELALPDGDGGVFLSGWLRDPLELVAGAELVTPAGSAAVAPDALHRISRPDVLAKLAKAQPASAPHISAHTRLGFVAHLPDPTGGAAWQPSLRLLLRSGATIELTPPLRPMPPHTARDTVLSSVPPREVQPDILARCLVPAASGLHRLARAERGAERVVRIGPPPLRPDISILVPLYRVLGFLRFQVTAFAEDPTCRANEMIYVLDSPEQADEVEHLLRGLHHVHALPITLVVMERNAGFAAATNAAARHATGRAVLLLNSDVVPVRPGWLDALQVARKRAGAVAATAKLLFDDGSLQHAGLYFARDPAGAWFNNHYHKGLPRHWPGADVARPVPGGTGAALLIERTAFERCGGVCEDYVVGDYEDSDLCLRLQQAGGIIVYEPRAELYHFERRSIAFHPGYTRTVACQYNRHVHHQRWDQAMSELMARPEYQIGTSGAA
jgi:GT2 family glycosyltransferase